MPRTTPKVGLPSDGLPSATHPALDKSKSKEAYLIVTGPQNTGVEAKQS